MLLFVWLCFDNFLSWSLKCISLTILHQYLRWCIKWHRCMEIWKLFLSTHLMGETTENTNDPINNVAMSQASLQHIRRLSIYETAADEDSVHVRSLIPRSIAAVDTIYRCLDSHL